LKKINAQHSQELELLQKEVADLAKDKKTLEEKNKFLQEKNKTITKNHKGNSLKVLACSCNVADYNVLHLLRYLYFLAIIQNSKSC
jgi:hypothetical protein